MREISPDLNMTVDEFLQEVPDSMRAIADEVRRQKRAGGRRIPSSSLVDLSRHLAPDDRAALLDRVAALVDENVFGRSEMCMQFSDLLSRALKRVGLPASAVVGTAMYYVDGKEEFRWEHSWVRVEDEVIDANVDVLDENPMIPSSVIAAPFWGPVRCVPEGRRLREDRSKVLPKDLDVELTWWPELREWIDERGLTAGV